MITMSAPSSVPGCARSQRSTPRKVTSGPYMPPRRDTIRGCLGPEVFRHLGEVVHVALNVVDGVLHRERPVLLGSGRHHHPAIALIQPAEVGERLVDLEVVAIVADPPAPVSDSPPPAHRDHPDSP